MYKLEVEVKKTGLGAVMHDLGLTPLRAKINVI
jgi:hypothetical protein